MGCFRAPRSRPSCLLEVIVLAPEPRQPPRDLVIHVSFFAARPPINGQPYVGRYSLQAAVEHLRDMANSAGSEGLFGWHPDKFVVGDVHAIAKEAALSLAPELLAAKGPIWRLFASVNEDDARAAGGRLFHRRPWEDSTRALLPWLADEMGIYIPLLRWIAVSHRGRTGKERHPHLHVLMWSATGSGRLRKRTLLAARQRWQEHLYLAGGLTPDPELAAWIAADLARLPPEDANDPC